MARKRFVAQDLSLAQCPRCGGAARGALYVDAHGTHAGTRCELCGVVVPVGEQPAITRRKTQYGDIIEIPFLSVIDAHEELLDLGVPIFTTEELALLPQRTPAERKRLYATRLRMMAAERRDRAAKAGRTVEGN